jgi:hypothetical protein
MKGITIQKVYEWNCLFCGANGYEDTRQEAHDRAKEHKEYHDTYDKGWQETIHQDKV